MDLGYHFFETINFVSRALITLLFIEFFRILYIYTKKNSHYTMVTYGRTVRLPTQPDPVNPYSYIQKTINVTSRTFVNKVISNKRTLYIQPIMRINRVMGPERTVFDSDFGSERHEKRYINEMVYNDVDNVWEDDDANVISIRSNDPVATKDFYIDNPATAVEVPVVPE